MSLVPETEETADSLVSTIRPTANRRNITRTQVINLIESFFPFILLSLSSLIIYFRWRQQIVFGPGWDPFAFLANALEFAGRGIGYSELHRAPLISFLTSLLFRAGFVSESALFLVDGALLLLGIIGLYYLLKLRFPSWLSLLGALLFLSFPTVLNMATTGYTDLPSVAISIWAVYFLILALENDRRFHWIAWPLLTLAALTRFTAFLLIIPILPLLIGKASIVRNLKDIAIGFAISFFILLPLFVIYYQEFGDPIFPFIAAFFSGTRPPPHLESFAIEPDMLWFFKSLKTFTLQPPFTTLFPLLAILIVMGLAIRVANLIRLTKKDSLRYSFILAALLFYLLVFLKFGFVIRQAVLVIIGILLYLHFQKTDHRKISLDIIFLLWFLTYFDFHSHDPIKIERYFIVMAPGTTYAALLGLESLANSISKNMFRASFNILIFLTLGLVAFASLGNVLRNPDRKDPLVVDAIKTSKWLKQNDPQISKAKIYSDFWPVFSWYLKQKVEPMPSFRDMRAFNHELEKYNVDYYLCIRNREIPSYDIKQGIGNVTIYKKNPSLVQSKARILYLGTNWEHYIEDVLDFNYFVIYEGDRYHSSRSIYIDYYNLEELKKYPLLILYNFKWHNRKRAEYLLRDYVSSGGRIIIDCTGNNGFMPYNLDGDTFLDIFITRKALSKTPSISISPKLTNFKPTFSPFLSDGSTWRGMTYQPIEPDTKLKVLATADNSTLIAEQRIGQGKVIWVGYNLVWHAFIKENKSERKLIKEIFKYSLL